MQLTAKTKISNNIRYLKKPSVVTKPDAQVYKFREVLRDVMSRRTVDIMDEVIKDNAARASLLSNAEFYSFVLGKAGQRLANYEKAKGEHILRNHSRAMSHANATADNCRVSNTSGFHSPVRGV